MPSYLLAIAVGPFDLVELGKRGRAHVPVRIAAPRGVGKQVVLAERAVPRAINALENYLGAPLPLAKLDLVAVPRFFGAMENPGLITIHASTLVSGDELITTIAHELAHQWFGDVVTPSWWDQLWLSEAFATWLGSRVAAQLEDPVAPEIAHQRRAEALAADEAVDAGPLVRAIASDDDIEATFDAIAYEKGAAVLAMFERFVGPQVFRRAAQSYVAGHAGQSVTSQAFFDALAAVSSPAVGAALASNVHHTGTPVIELAVACGAAPAITAEVRDGVTLPVCVRYPAHPGARDTTAACMLAGAHTELAVPAVAGCPAWVIGNTDGLGYYRTAWRDPATAPPIAVMSPDERLVYADDVAGAVRQGELPIAAALARLTALAATGDPADGVAALAIARAVNPLVDAATSPAWRGWLGRRFARQLSPDVLRMSPYRYAREMGGQLSALISLVGDGAGPATLAAARNALASGAARDLVVPLMIGATAAGSATALERIRSDAAAPRSADGPGEPLELLGWFPGRYAPRIVDLLLDHQHAPGDVWPALETQLRRGVTRSAAWHAVHERFAAVAGALAPDALADAIGVASALCTQTERAELAGDAGPWLARLPGGHHAADVALHRALATIDRCIARRAAAGDVAAALAAP
jgi:alanyl aminopeptidase